MEIAMIHKNRIEELTTGDLVISGIEGGGGGGGESTSLIPQFPGGFTSENVIGKANVTRKTTMTAISAGRKPRKKKPKR